MDDLNTSVRAFTDGLRDLPTDDVARVQRFLAEYLGDSRHPVPFGGRERDVARLDAWLADRHRCSWPRRRAGANRPCFCAGAGASFLNPGWPSSMSR